MTQEEFQLMVSTYIGCVPVYIKTGTKPSFSGWTMVSEGYYDVTPEQKEKALTLSRALQIPLHTIYRYANGNASPHPGMMAIVQRKINEVSAKS